MDSPVKLILDLWLVHPQPLCLELVLRCLSGGPPAWQSVCILRPLLHLRCGGMMASSHSHYSVLAKMASSIAAPVLQLWLECMSWRWLSRRWCGHCLRCRLLLYLKDLSVIFICVCVLFLLHKDQV
uniref:Uncharacterized protein n=1 Tax=Arundo donax TaxID=35708 RepID=A0A0A8YKB0_ARUDO